MALVRSRLSSKLNSRVDPEDMLQSAYRSFFGALGDGRFMVERSDGLWSLLAAITLHKLHRQVAFHTAKKRSIQREQSKDDSLLGVQPEIMAQSPTPAEAAALVEELEQVMTRREVRPGRLTMRRCGCPPLRPPRHYKSLVNSYLLRNVP
jgi:hypothetical protein